MGGQAKARGTREQRIAQALQKKEREIDKLIDVEIAFCYNQKYFEDNIKLFIHDIEEEKELDKQSLLILLNDDYKSMKVGQILKSDFKKYPSWPFLSITVKKQARYSFKIIYETIYGIASKTFSSNGTAGWHLVETTSEEIINRCYDRIAMLRYNNDKIEEEFGIV